MTKDNLIFRCVSLKIDVGDTQLIRGYIVFITFVRNINFLHNQAKIVCFKSNFLAEGATKGSSNSYYNCGASALHDKSYFQA